MKKSLFVVIVFAAALAVAALVTPTPVEAASGCATVRCMACPDGYHLSLHWPNCCRCIKN